MSHAAPAVDSQFEIARLRDELEQMRTALEASSEDVGRLVEDRDRLLRRVTAQARDLLAANAAYTDAASDRKRQAATDRVTSAREQEQEELRVAFEEMQVLTEELEVANGSLHEINKVLDERVQHRTEELQAKNMALVESEMRFRTLVEGIPQLVWRATEHGAWTWASPQWTAYTGQEAADSRGWNWLEALHPEDREATRAAWARASQGRAMLTAYRLRRASDDTYRWFQSRATPALDAAGRVVEWFGASTDVQGLRALQERQKVLLFELQHRVRNTLAVVRSIASSTGENSETVTQFAAHLAGRLNALARTQMVLTRTPGLGVDLEFMVRNELMAQAARAEQIEVSGPEVRLSPKAAEVLTLAIHELTTNALKYGALSASAGRVVVGWSTAERKGKTVLEFAWKESGGPVAAAAPRREGFGTELIKVRVPYELRGHGALNFNPEGLQCEIDFPLDFQRSILQTDAPIPEFEEG